MKLKNLRLVLASQSPRRKELLQGLDIPFTVAVPYEVDESYPAHLAKDEVPLYLSQLKAEKYPYFIGNQDIIITADTLVWCKNQFLGKPKNEQAARQFLQMLSGNTHEVLTGVCLRSIEQTHSFVVSTQVFFSSLSDDEIDYYIQHYYPYDKAGAYGIQDWIGYVGIERIEGSYYNVMGLPVQRLYKELENFVCQQS